MSRPRPGTEGEIGIAYADGCDAAHADVIQSQYRHRFLSPDVETETDARGQCKGGGLFKIKCIEFKMCDF